MSKNSLPIRVTANGFKRAVAHCVDFNVYGSAVMAARLDMLLNNTQVCFKHIAPQLRGIASVVRSRPVIARPSHTQHKPSPGRKAEGGLRLLSKFSFLSLISIGTVCKTRDNANTTPVPNPCSTIGWTSPTLEV